MLELQQTHEALRSTHEEMQTSVEEAKSANEELQVSNEELITSKEELQSMNEELQTVNAELQSKVNALTWARNDMTNLLNSTQIATIFLDNQMKLRRYTTYATHIFKFIPADVGRSLSDIVTDLDYPSCRPMRWRCFPTWSSASSRQGPRTAAGIVFASCRTARRTM